MPHVPERYELRHPLASGGMATVYLGRMSTHAGLSRTVAIKRLHPHVAANPAFVAMFFDEARLAMRIQHPNVVGTFDVAQVDGEQLLVMDYIHGESLVVLMQGARARGEPIPPAVLSSILGGVLAGLHAAHEVCDETGAPLGIVHRDVSPQNVLVGVDGVARVLDFGVAKAVGRMQTTETGQVKGKLAYMAPEQMTAREVDRRADLFAAGALLWEGLANRRLFDGDGPAQIVGNVLALDIAPPRGLGDALDRVALKALERHPDLRFATAREMAVALEQACPPAAPREVESWLRAVASASLAARSERVAEMESGGSRPSATALPRDGARRELAPTDARSGPDDDTLSTMGSSLAPPSRARPRRGRALLAVALVSVLAAPLLVFGLTRRAVDHRESQASSPTQAVAATLAPMAAMAPVAATPAPTPPAAVEDHGPDAALVVSAPAVTPAPRAPSRSPTTPRGAVLLRAGKKPDCTNPFTVTAEGIRVPRPECF
jgi:serine/threonine-protein kinase